MASNVFPVSYIEPCFLLSSLRFVFPIGSSLYTVPYTLSTTIISLSLFLHLVLLAPVNSCELHNNNYLVLSFLLMYSSSGLSTDGFPNKHTSSKRLGAVAACWFSLVNKIVAC